MYLDWSDDKEQLYITCESRFLPLPLLTSHYYELYLFCVHIVLKVSDSGVLLSFGECSATLVVWFLATLLLIKLYD